MKSRVDMEEVEVQVPTGLSLGFWRDKTTGVEGRIRAPGLDGFPTRSLYLDGSRDLEGFLREHVPVAQWRRTGRRGPKQVSSRPSTYSMYCIHQLIIGTLRVTAFEKSAGVFLTVVLQQQQMAANARRRLFYHWGEDM